MADKSYENSKRSLFKVSFDSLSVTKTTAVKSVVESFSYVNNLGTTAAELTEMVQQPGLAKKDKDDLTKAINSIKPLLDASSHTEALKLSKGLSAVSNETLLKVGKQLTKLRISKEAVTTPAENLRPALSAGETSELTDNFESRVTKQNYGWLHLERLDMRPTMTIEEGELVYSLPLAPSEKVTLFHKEWSSQSKEMETIISESFETSDENSVEDKRDASMSTESQSQLSTAFSISAGYSSSLLGVSFSTNFSKTASESVSQKNSAQQTQTLTKKSSAKARKEHKVTFKTSMSEGMEDSSTRTLENPDTDTVLQLDYYRPMREWEMSMTRYGIRLAYDIVIPNPAKDIINSYKRLKELDDLIAKPFEFTLLLDQIELDNTSSEFHFSRLAAKYNAIIDPPNFGDTESAPGTWSIPAGTNITGWYMNTISIPIPDNKQVSGATFHAAIRVNDESKDAAAFWFVYPSLPYHFYQDGENLVRNTFGMNGYRGDKTSTVRPNSFLLPSGENNDGYTTALNGCKKKVDIVFTWYYCHDLNVSVRLFYETDPKVVMAWKAATWQKLYDAAYAQYTRSIEQLQQEKEHLEEKINLEDSMALRQREREEMMKRVLGHFFGLNFSDQAAAAVVAGVIGRFDAIKSLAAKNTPAPPETIIPGELITFLSQAVEWEHVLYVLYPYFWSNSEMRAYKMYLDHEDRIHRDFLRAGSARVVLTIRRGWENAFVNAVENGLMSVLEVKPPIMPIAQELQTLAWQRFRDLPPDGTGSESDFLDSEIEPPPFAHWKEYLPASGLIVRATRSKVQS